MPIISATKRRARDFRACASCMRRIAPRTEYVRAYGYAHPGDLPYAISLHVDCACTETREKLKPAPKRRKGAR